MRYLTLLACKGSACHAQHVTTMVAYGGLCCVNCLKSVNAAVPSHHIPGSYADARCDDTSCPPSVCMHVASSIMTLPWCGRALALALRPYKSRVPIDVIFIGQLGGGLGRAGPEPIWRCARSCKFCCTCGVRSSRLQVMQDLPSIIACCAGGAIACFDSLAGRCCRVLRGAPGATA